ncbi:MAG: hypothetical protein M3512_08160, partial [Bacteroidota bacterium]|nr:hypothetical protein [Bacteroidota bacterium]
MNWFRFLLSIMLLTISITSFAQKETNIWYFGDYAGLDFNSNPPKVLTDGALKSHEGSSVISDKNGNLLFYTNGMTVWNMNHQIM